MSVTIYFFRHLTDTFFTYTFKQRNLLSGTQYVRAQFVRLKIFGSKIFFGHKIFSDPQPLWTHIYFALKGFFNRNICSSNTAVDTQKKLAKNLFLLKILKCGVLHFEPSLIQILPNLNTFQLSLVEV